MKYIITSECVSCGVCEEVCPVSAIKMGPEQYYITEACVGCGKCEASCPIEAIKGSQD